MAPGGSGHMETLLIVVSPQPHAKTNRRLQADQRCLGKGYTIHANLLGNRQSRRDHGDRGMTDVCEMRVVIVQRMGTLPPFTNAAARAGERLEAPTTLARAPSPPAAP